MNQEVSLLKFPAGVLKLVGEAKPLTKHLQNTGKTSELQQQYGGVSSGWILPNVIGQSANTKRCYYLLIILFSFTACSGQRSSVNQPAIFIDTNKTFKKEIPSVNIFYTLAKAKQKQLGLDSLENGYDNLQIRLWYDFSLVRERRLVVITAKDTNWTATVYYLQVGWDGRTETILSKNIKQVTPKSGWVAFVKQLMDLKIMTLPNQYDIKGYGGGFDGRTYNVELATKNQYRFYGYWEPQQYQSKFWQAKNMTHILKLFETELGV